MQNRKVVAALREMDLCFNTAVAYEQYLNHISQLQSMLTFTKMHFFTFLRRIFFTCPSYRCNGFGWLGLFTCSVLSEGGSPFSSSSGHCQTSFRNGKSLDSYCHCITPRLANPLQYSLMWHLFSQYAHPHSSSIQARNSLESSSSPISSSSWDAPPDDG